MKGVAMDLVKVRMEFTGMWIIAFTSMSVFVTGRGPEHQSYMQDPYIVSPERVQYGSDIHMTCYILSLVKFVSQISFIWNENDERLINGTKYEMIPGTGTLGKTRYYTNTLTVRDMMKSDEGKRYMCQVDVEVGTGTMSYNTEEYLLGTTLSPSTTTTADEGEDVTIFLTWSVTDVVLGFWSPGDRLLVTIQSISVYIWLNSRSKFKVSGLITSPYRKTVKFVICNATHEDAGRYDLTEFKRRVKHGAYSLVIAAPMSTKVASNMVLSTEGHTKSETAGVASITSAYTHALMSTKVASNMLPSIEVQTKSETAGVASTTSDYTHDVTAVILYIIAGCSVLLLVLAVFIIAAIVLIRIKQQALQQRSTQAPVTTANIVQAQRYDVTDCSATEPTHLYAENSSGYHTLNLKRFKRLNELYPTDTVNRKWAVHLDQDYEQVTLRDSRPVLNCILQCSDDDEECDECPSLCYMYDDGQRQKDHSGYAQCIVVEGHVSME